MFAKNEIKFAVPYFVLHPLIHFNNNQRRLIYQNKIFIPYFNKNSKSSYMASKINKVLLRSLMSLKKECCIKVV